MEPDPNSPSPSLRTTLWMVVGVLTLILVLTHFAS